MPTPPPKRENLKLKHVLTGYNLACVQQEKTYLVINGDLMVRKGIFWTIGEHLYFVYYLIISYQSINVYRVETMDMGIYF